METQNHISKIQILVQQKKYVQAEQQRDLLAGDHTNADYLAMRAEINIKQDKHQAALHVVNNAIGYEPENAFTHTNYGWGLLEKGDHRKALEHFIEAVQKHPDFSLARSGLSKALKARSLFYRLYLKYSFFMGKLSAKGQWAVLIGFFLGVRFLRAIAQRNEAWQPYFIPAIVGLTLLTFSTWMINPIGNLFLRLDKYGCLLLDKKERSSANFVGLSLLLFLAGIALFFALSDQRYLTLAVFGFLMMVPCGSMLSPAKSKYVLPVYTAVLATTGVAGMALVFLNGEIFNVMTAAFLVGFFVFQWVANFILVKEDNV